MIIFLCHGGYNTRIVLAYGSNSTEERDIIAIYCCWWMSTRRQCYWYPVLQRCCYLSYMSMLLTIENQNRLDETKENWCEVNSHVLVGWDDCGKICLVTERYRGSRSIKLVVNFLSFTLVTTYSFLLRYTGNRLQNNTKDIFREGSKVTRIHVQGWTQTQKQGNT